MNGLMTGVNLGGWLSQYREYDHEHFRTFITRSDIERIAQWGFDHVRLPVDYPVIESDDSIGEPIEEGYGYIDECLQWCAGAGLAMVLDIHHAPGFSFTHELEAETRGTNHLFDVVEVQDRFVALWETIARRYRDAPIPVVFELLNEVVLPDSEPWKALSKRLARAIRAIDADTPIMVGGNHNNSVEGLCELGVLDEANMVYTFHFYEPLLFTHQNAYWSEAPREWGASPEYPGEFPGLAEFLEANPQHRAVHQQFVGRRNDRDLLAEMMQPAVDFGAEHGVFVYCGEFGVADWVEPVSRRRWYRDFVGLMRENGIGSSVWSYKQMDFGLVDADGEVVDPEVLAILAG